MSRKKSRAGQKILQETQRQILGQAKALGITYSAADILTMRKTALAEIKGELDAEKQNLSGQIEYFETMGIASVEAGDGVITRRDLMIKLEKMNGFVLRAEMAGNKLSRERIVNER
jgi:hypothetical protein